MTAAVRPIFTLLIFVIEFVGRGSADNQHRQESCGDMRGAERVRLPWQGGQPHQGQGGEGDGAGGLAVRRRPEGSLRLLSVPGSEPIFQLRPHHHHCVNVQSYVIFHVNNVRPIKHTTPLCSRL